MATPYVGLLIDGSWVDVSSYVLYEAGITVARGHRSESGGMEASTAALTFKNFDGRFTPDHPLSPYYGKLGRNTPIRIARDTPNLDTYLYMPGGPDNEASTPDSAALSITGDTDVRLELALEYPAIAQSLCSKYEFTGNQRSWYLRIDDGGTLTFTWSADGTTTLSATSTAAVDVDSFERFAVRATIDVNNGAGGRTVTFYTSDSISGSWTMLGAAVTAAGTTSIFNSTAPVSVGEAISMAPLQGYAYAFELRNGIGGSVVASPDFTAQDDQTTSFADAQGNTWTITGISAFLHEGPWRFHGEVPGWPVVSDVTGRMVTVSIEAAGRWRRLVQNQEPENSVMYRSHIRNPANLKQYWPLEDASESTRAASAIAGYPAMVITGTPQMAAYDGWTASAAMPQLDSGRFSGRVPPFASTGDNLIYLFIFVDTVPAAEADLFTVITTGTARKWRVRLLANGNLRIRAYDDGGSEIDDGGGNLGSELTFDMDSRGFTILALQLSQNGSDVDWNLSVYDFVNTDNIDDSLSSSGFIGTATGVTLGSVQTVILNDEGAVGDTKASHLAVSDDDSLFSTVGIDAIRAYNGQTPRSWVVRLCKEEDIPLMVVSKGTVGDTVTMGDQRVAPLSELLTDAETSHFGILFETRERLGLGFRTRPSMANRGADVTLSHSSHELGATLSPVQDDQLTVNDITLTRDQGSSIHVAKEAGDLSVLDPAQGGVGRYPDSQTLSITFDSQLPDQAGFRLRLGTEPGARYPEITANLHHPTIAGTSLEDDLLAADMGDRIAVTDLPAHLPPDDVSVLIQGYAERFDQFLHSITFVCVPEKPWRWLLADDDDKRADTLGSTTATDFDAGTDTSMTVATTEGPLWTTNAASVPFNIRVSGVVLEVTAVSGSSSPQTLTITQAPVNGVEKTIPSGSAVNVAEPAYVGMW